MDDLLFISVGCVHSRVHQFMHMNHYHTAHDSQPDKITKAVRLCEESGVGRVKKKTVGFFLSVLLALDVSGWTQILEGGYRSCFVQKNLCILKRETNLKQLIASEINDQVNIDHSLVFRKAVLFREDE